MNGRRIAKVAGGAVSVMLVATFVAGVVTARNTSRDVLAEARKPYETHGTKFLDDLRALEATPPFPLGGSEKDAGPYLNPRVPWFGKQPLIDEHTKANAGVPSVRMSQPLLDRLATYRDKWTDHTDDAELLAVDTSWLKALEAYDHWDVDANGPAVDPTRYASWDKPLPGVAVFLPAAKVHLMRGLRDGDARTAAREVRHAARLLHSTESDIAAIIAVNLLDLERVAYEKQKTTTASVEGWSVVDKETSARLRRVAVTYPALAEVYAPSELSAKAFQQSKPTWARCAALNLGVSHALMTRAMLQTEMSPRYEQLAGLLAATKGDCRLRALRTAWAKHPNAYGAFTGSREEICAELSMDGTSKKPTVCRAWLFSRLIPGGAAAVGHTLASLATTSFATYANPPP